MGRMIYHLIGEPELALCSGGGNPDRRLYGARWNRETNQLTRLYQAAEITTDTRNFGHFGSINPSYDNPFDRIYPWSKMAVCNVDLAKYRSGSYSLTECITARYGEPGFTYAGSSTNFVGRYRPEFWYKAEEDSSGNVDYLISQVAREGFSHAEEAIDGISFGIDDGAGGLTCGSGIPLTNISVANIHGRARASGFTIQDIRSLDEQIMLYLVEYANMNSQAALGDGCSSCYRENDADVISDVTTAGGRTSFQVADSALSSVIYVGAQLDIGATKGAVTHRGLVAEFTAANGVYSITLDRELPVTDGMIMSVHGFSACEFDLLGRSIGSASGYLGANTKGNSYYRGCVMFGNRYQYILGIYRQQNTSHLWLCPEDADPDDYDALNTSVHQDTGVALPALEAAGWQVVGGNAQRLPGLAAFLATGTSSGSSASPVGDQQYLPLPTTGNTILLSGCGANHGWYCGLFGGSWNYGSGYSHWSFAARPILKKSL